MSKDDPGNAEVDKHLSTDFTGESTALLHPAVLSSNLDLWAQLTLDGGKEDIGRADDNLDNIRRGDLSSVQSIDDTLYLFDSSIAFPVAADEELAAHGDGGGGRSDRVGNDGRTGEGEVEIGFGGVLECNLGASERV